MGSEGNSRAGLVELGKVALGNEMAFGSRRATSERWSQCACGSRLCVWNTATLKIYLQVLCLYGEIIFYNYPYSFKEKIPRSPSDDNAVERLSHTAQHRSPRRQPLRRGELKLPQPQQVAQHTRLPGVKMSEWIPVPSPFKLPHCPTALCALAWPAVPFYAS